VPLNLPKFNLGEGNSGDGGSGHSKQINSSLFTRTKASLAAAAKARPGTFFADPHYFDSLPRAAKLLIYGVQMEGAHPDRPGFCNAKGHEALGSFIETESRDDLKMAIALYAMATLYMSADDPNCAKFTHSLAKALEYKWETLKNSVDLDSAIEWYRKTVMITKKRQRENLLYTCNLARLLASRFAIANDANDFEEARASYESACTLSQGTKFHAMLIKQSELFLSTHRPPLTTDAHGSNNVPTLHPQLSTIQPQQVAAVPFSAFPTIPCTLEEFIAMPCTTSLLSS
jgi:hypothetical protein